MDLKLEFDVPVTPIGELHRRLGWQHPIDFPAASLQKPLTQWRMEDDDSPIFRYVYRNFRPRRHLEFGTWEGTGTLYVLEECDASVWTINLLEGETNPDGSWAYSSNFSEGEIARIPWSKRVSNWVKNRTVGRAQSGQALYCYRTDALGFIGRYYLERGLGSRVCQIYSDSRTWDDRNYPDGFFDTCLIDGGHQPEIVASDTAKALRLVRSKGIILWHDFCPVPEVMAACSAPRGVVAAVKNLWPRLQSETTDLFWVQPSHILLGLRR